MGGPGSGSWYRWYKKTVVEDCLALDVNSLARDGGISRDRWISANYTWISANGGPPLASVDYDLIPASSGPVLRLRYTVSPPRGPRACPGVCPVGEDAVPLRRDPLVVHLSTLRLQDGEAVQIARG